jgi:hypothetical protein
MLARVERQGDDAGARAIQESFRIITTGEPEIEPAIDIPMFSNDALLTVEFFDQPMLDRVLASAPDAITISDGLQDTARKIAGFAGQGPENRQEVKDLIEDKALPVAVDPWGCPGGMERDHRLPDRIPGRLSVPHRRQLRGNLVERQSRGRVLHEEYRRSSLLEQDAEAVRSGPVELG